MAEKIVTTPPIDEFPPGMKRQVIHKDKIWRLIRVGGFLGHIAAEEVPVESPVMIWEGGPISMQIWSQICAFFEWSQQEFKAETQVRLYYNRTTQRWAPWAYPQTPNGMSTQEVADHADVPAQRLQFPDPWVLLGTVHHHCTCGAFQSGTDRHNEENQEGIHITVGNIGSGEYTLHNRVVVRQCQYEGVPWNHWFELPERWRDLPKKIAHQAVEHALKTPPPSDTPFPEQWKTNCIRRPIVIHNSNYSGRSFERNGSAATVYPRVWVPVITDLRGQFTKEEIGFMEEIATLQAIKNCSHSNMDMVVNEVEFKTLPERDQEMVNEVIKSANLFKIDDTRVDELFDKWDFATVTEYLAKHPETPAAPPPPTAETMAGAAMAAAT